MIDRRALLKAAVLLPFAWLFPARKQHLVRCIPVERSRFEASDYGYYFYSHKSEHGPQGPFRVAGLKTTLRKGAG